MKSNKNTRLVAYESTDEENEDYSKRKKLQLPYLFFDLYQVRPMMGDDPVFHEGRKRTHSSVPGIIPPEDLQCLLKKIYELCILEGIMFTSLLEDDLGMSLPLHVSLSRPFMLTSDMIDSFRETMKINILFKRQKNFFLE
ncbi:hypothetical protein PMAC_002462 [Pneumocystis sp. 'macacae']|nr:hypothetical protein PMAC_002462 [Pneumocystis sp. 'macacae']